MTPCKCVACLMAAVKSLGFSRPLAINSPSVALLAVCSSPCIEEALCSKSPGAEVKRMACRAFPGPALASGSHAGSAQDACFGNSCTDARVLSAREAKEGRPAWPATQAKQRGGHQGR